MKKSRIVAAGMLALSMFVFPMAGNTQTVAQAADGYADVQIMTGGYDEIAAVSAHTFVAKKDGKYGMLRFDGSEVLPFVYDGCRMQSDDNMLTLWRTGGSYGTSYEVFDENGVLQFDADAYLTEANRQEQERMAAGDARVSDRMVSAIQDFNYANGVIYINSGIYVWYLNVDGAVLKEIYCGAGARATKVSPNGTALYKQFDDGLGEDVSHVSTMGYVTRDGAFALAQDWIDWSWYPIYTRGNYTLYRVRENGKSSVYRTCHIDRTFQQVLSGDWSYIGITGNGVFFDTDNDNYYAFWSAQAGKTAEKYSYIEPCTEEKRYYLAGIDDHFFYLNDKGEEIGFSSYMDASSFRNGKAMVVDTNHQAYQVNENFERLSDTIYADSVTATRAENTYILKNGGKSYVAVIENKQVALADDSNWYCYLNGEVATEYTGLAYNAYGWWYIRNGQVDFGYNGLVEYYGAWWCVANGQVIFDYTGLWYDENIGWWYVKDGAVDTSFDGLKDNAYGWWKCSGGRVDFDYTGLVPNAYGWWYVKDGGIDFTFTGLVQNEYGWWYVKDGAIDFTYDGLAENEYGMWKVKDGAVDFTFDGLAPNAYGWWKFNGGLADVSYTGLVPNAYGWWYVKDGAIDFTYDGLAENEHGWWKVQDGAVDFTYDGLAENEHGWWYVKDGAVDFTFDGLVPNAYGWWKCSGGMVDFGYTGYAQNVYGTWFVRNGCVDVNVP